MATGNFAIERLALVTGLSENELGHLTRVLRRHSNGEFWPISHQGGRSKAVHVMPAQIGYLAFALGYGLPADGPEAAEAFRAMTMVGKISADDDKVLAGVLREVRKLTLGQTLEALINRLALTPDSCPDFTLVMHKARELPDCFAEVYVTKEKRTLILPYTAPDMHKKAHETSLAFETTATFGHEYWKLAAELWVDTQNHWAGLKAASEI